MCRKARASAASAVAFIACLIAGPAAPDSFVGRNANVVGTTPAGFYRGLPHYQDNEARCAQNPLLPRNIVCAWNGYGGADDIIGDAWIRTGHSNDNGRTWLTRYVTGSDIHPASSIGQDFAADPITLCWPGGCGVALIASTRAGAGGAGGGVYFQLMAEQNVESGFRHLSEVGPRTVQLATGGTFLDKIDAIYMIDEDSPGTVEVPMTLELGYDEVTGEMQTISVVRHWPKARILFVYAAINASNQNIRIYSTYTDDYGVSFSPPKQVAVTTGLDTGVAVSAIGDTVFYGYRQFRDPSGDNTDAILGAVSPNAGKSIGKPFEVVPDLCAFDQPTMPNAAVPNMAAARTNDFLSVSNNRQYFVMTYSERRLAPDGSCLTPPFDYPSDSRVLIAAAPATGKNWGTPVPVAPNDAHGFQFMPAVDCSLGVCQVIWYDSIRDSEKTIAFLDASAETAARDAFVNNPIFGDFNVARINGPVGEVIQFRRTADVRTRRFAIEGGVPVPTDSAPVRVSRYQLALLGGELFEAGSNPFHIKAYKSNTVPFMSDYIGVTSPKLRVVVDPSDPSSPPTYADNAGIDPNDPDRKAVFFAHWTDARNARGHLYTGHVEDPVPFQKTAGGGAFARRQDAPAAGPDGPLPAERQLSAESVDDSNPGAGFCTPIADPPGHGELFIAINNRIKDSDIYGAFIEDRSTAWAINPTKTLGAIQRVFVIVARNEKLVPATFRFEIANQPVGAPLVARASWKQLPFDPPFSPADPPQETLLEDAGPQSSVAVALFVVSQDAINPVTVNVFDDASGELVEVVTVNGTLEAGPLLNADGTPNDFEIHNPEVTAPDVFNPDVLNPDVFNPDVFNPDVFNPDVFNPDVFNPDVLNPDVFNPDVFNPDVFNPDVFNPDVFNPDVFNSTLTDADNLDNPEIPHPGISGMVSKFDLVFGVTNVGNTMTPYTADFAVVSPLVQGYLDSGQAVAQLIAWQDAKIDDYQFCTPRTISQNRILAVTNDPDLTELEIPDIFNNRFGSITYYAEPGDTVLITLRFLAEKEIIKQMAPELVGDAISYVVSSQAANTGETVLFKDREQVIRDVTPPAFNRADGEIAVLPAAGPDGATLPPDFVTAMKGPLEVVPVDCAPALGSTIGLDIFNVGGEPTPLSCTATASNDITATLDMFVSVLDMDAPVIDPASVPADIAVETEGPDGAPVIFGHPVANDVNGVDPAVDVVCTAGDPPTTVVSGDVFPFVAPGPTTTTVTCIGTDDSGNASAPESFDVIVQDTTAPTIGGLDPPLFDQPEPFVLADDLSFFRLRWGPFDVMDADPGLNVSCSVGELDLSLPLYTFVHDFGVGTTVVTCTAEDFAGNFDSGSFEVTVLDTTGPVITLEGDSPLTMDTTSDPYVDPGATAFDNADGDISDSVVIDATEVDTESAGSYSVYISATDSSGNRTEVIRTVIVEFRYAGASGVDPRKIRVNVGSSNPLLWAWLDENGSAVDSSGDVQLLRIENCATGDIVLAAAGDPGTSGFRFKANRYWQFNWQTDVAAGQEYCAYVQSSLTGQEQYSPPISAQ